MPNQQLIKYLDQHHVHYDTIMHETTFTAQETAAAAHVSGKSMAKTVIVKIDAKLALVLVPANVYVNLPILKDLTGASELDLATESEFAAAFPDCELGAMPPFGELYNLAVYASNRFTTDDEIVFNAGNHAELIRLSWEDFQKLAKPTLLDL